MRPHVHPATIAVLFFFCFASATSGEPIDRQSLVTRHNVRLESPNINSPLSVGNGAFCFTADITGLQTFEQDYLKGIPLGTMPDWAWHTTPGVKAYRLEETLVDVPGAGGHVASYPLTTSTPAGKWLRANPHRFSVGQIGLVMTKSDGSPAKLGDLQAVDQQLDLWRGLLTSRFTLEDQLVTVQTCACPSEDAVAVRVESPLLSKGRLRIRIAFPYPNGSWGKTFNDWNSPDRHETRVVSSTPGKMVLGRRLDATRYGCTILVDHGKVEQAEPHTFLIQPTGERLEFVVSFRESEEPSRLAPSFDDNASAAAKHMQDYWTSGGAVDLSKSSDPRWRELERRIVLSQYLVGIQSRGHYPPQETGLTCNSWHGKFHLEMHWWHSVQFALWGRESVLERQLQWYEQAMPVMRATAKRQGYEGVRWGKMLGPDGREAPSGIGPLLVWQQPHPIYYAELLYRLKQDPALLERYGRIVDQTARFMADFATWNDERKCYELGPPFISAREFAGREYKQNRNGGFELSYWRWALLTAGEWRKRQGKEPIEAWTRIAQSMAPLPVHDGVYVEQEQVLVPDGGHPCQLASWGLLPKSPQIDPATMQRTMDKVLHHWDHSRTWGWDYPMMAMTAARLGRGDWAIDALLLDQGKNTYLPNGHNHQTDTLPIYLPGNGGLLTAVAMMAAGWDDAPARPAPGFPTDGTWTVQHEGLQKMP